MGKQYLELTPQHIDFIQQQKIFFVATAAQTGSVNLSPKGGDSLRVIDHKTIVWQNLTGSGNESAAHTIKNPRMTLMWCAFEGAPLILRTYGNAPYFIKLTHNGKSTLPFSRPASLRGNCLCWTSTSCNPLVECRSHCLIIKVIETNLQHGQRSKARKALRPIGARKISKVLMGLKRKLSFVRASIVEQKSHHFSVVASLVEMILS